MCLGEYGDGEKKKKKTLPKNCIQKLYGMYE